jgi:hypothetical protein
MGADAAIRRWEFCGVVWIVAAGVPLHFLHSSTGWAAVAWLAPVNESIWEHFKLAFWPGLAWAAIEWTALPERRAGLWTGKLVSLALTPILIAAVFTGYTAILGTHLLAIDIATFVVAVAVALTLGPAGTVAPSSDRQASAGAPSTHRGASDSKAVWPVEPDDRNAAASSGDSTPTPRRANGRAPAGRGPRAASSVADAHEGCCRPTSPFRKGALGTGWLVTWPGPSVELPRNRRPRPKRNAAGS